MHRACHKFCPKAPYSFSHNVEAWHCHRLWGWAWSMGTEDGYALTVHHPLRNRKTYSCFLISMPELMGMKSGYHLWALHNVRSAQSDLFWCFLGERFFWLLAFTWLWCAVGSSNDKYELKNHEWSRAPLSSDTMQTSEIKTRDGM